MPTPSSCDGCIGIVVVFDVVVAVVRLSIGDIVVTTVVGRKSLDTPVDRAATHIENDGGMRTTTQCGDRVVARQDE